MLARSEKPGSSQQEETPLLTCNGAFAWFKRAGRIDLERLVEPIVAEAAAARQSRAVRAYRHVATLLRNVTLREHRAGGEGE
jgi:hypothetical protein